MSMSNKQQRELFESAIHAVYNNEINESEVNSDQISDETSAELDNIEVIVMDYINNAIPNTVNESTSDEELEQEVFEAVQNLNTLCHIVNEYFNYEGWLIKNAPLWFFYEGRCFFVYIFVLTAVWDGVKSSCLSKKKE